MPLVMVPLWALLLALCCLRIVFNTLRRFIVLYDSRVGGRGELVKSFLANGKSLR